MKKFIPTKIKDYIKNKKKKFIYYLKLDNSISVSENLKEYTSFVIKAADNDDVFKSFRQNEIYCWVLEHDNLKRGLENYKYIQKISKLNKREILEILSNIDKFGGPKLITIGDLNKVSPSSLRYLSIATDINRIFKYKADQELNIIEIGCGYGGQSIALSKLNNIKNYTYVDLKEVNQLIEKYVSMNEVSFKYQTKTLFDDFDDNYDLIVSNYAFSELPRYLQQIAYKKILSKCKNGYMINNSFYFSKKYKFFDKKKLKKLLPSSQFFDENPKAEGHPENFLHVF
jgi:SAM-dependent methyltransferase